MYIITKKASLSSPRAKYYILFSIIVVFTLGGVTVTYHVVLIASVPILYALLYTSKKVMWYVYSLTVISTIITVYGGYYFGVCDANMALLTSTKLDNYLDNGQFTLLAVNDNPLVTLMLYFIIPRCLIYVAFMVVCSNIYRITKSSLEKAESVVELEVFQKALKSKVAEQTAELREQQRKLNEAYQQTITTLSEAIDAKDRYTSGHSRRVAKYSKMIAERMGKSEAEQEMIYRMGLLHDVGKIRIPVDIINKPGKLTDEEYELIKIHPVTGYYILKDISEGYDIAIAAKYHHERYDGKGYPNGLANESIPQMARILAVADSYDAMTSNRSYRKGLPQSVVRSEIEKGRGNQFDTEIADIMLQMIDEDKDYELRQSDRASCKILVLGEDASCNQRVKDIIIEEGIYEVEVKNTVVLEEVLEIIKEQHFGLVIFDIHIDNGWEILRTLMEKTHLPVVLMTEDIDLRNKEEFIELGCDDYFMKSIKPIMLKEIIYNITKKFL